MTLISFLTGIVASILLFISIPLGGLIYQISSILDGCDGEIARATMRRSKIGEYYDSILDRWVDFTFLLVLAYASNLSHLWIPLALAIFGTVMVSYSTEKYKASFYESAYVAIPSLKYLFGKRDERIFVTMLFCLAGYVSQLIILLAVWTNLRVIATFFVVYKNKKG
jgi:CDP-L-myo-inositol myo-inositolphosphotransferase